MPSAGSASQLRLKYHGGTSTLEPPRHYDVTADSSYETDFAAYFSGSKLYGDDFGEREIEEWYKAEENGYFDISRERGGHRYLYRALDNHHFYSRVAIPNGAKLLGLGAADGAEYERIAPSVGEFHVVEIAQRFWSDRIFGRPAFYRQPSVLGTLEYPDDSFDVATVFSTMHHVANVSYVMGEIFRVLKPGGLLLMREPIVSMGDWRQPRRGLTRNERGIPLPFLRELLSNIGFRTVHEGLCVSPFIRKLSDFMPTLEPYNNRALTTVDAIASATFRWKIKYHHTSVFDKLAPQSVALIARK